MTLPTRGALGAALLVPVVAALAACSFSSSAAASGTPSAVSSQSAAPASATSPSSTAPTYRKLTPDQLVKTLLTLDGLPAGYTAEKPDLTDSNETFCHYKQPNKENGYAAITFDGGSSSAIGHTIRQYDSVADASAQQDALAKAVQAGCSMTENGTKLKVAQMSAPKLGDRTIGVALTGGGVTIDEVFVQVGPSVLAIAEAGVGSANVTEMTSLAKKAIAKYESAAGGN